MLQIKKKSFKGVQGHIEYTQCILRTKNTPRKAYMKRKQQNEKENVFYDINHKALEDQNYTL